MPFRLKPWKSRNYSIVSKNVQIVTVELVDQTLLETSAPADATGFYCMRHVCHKLGLKQPEFFGFTYVSKKPYPKLRWIDLERPVKKQLEKDAQSPILYLVVQYYIYDLSLLQDVQSRNFFYQQIKKDVLDGKITTNKEQAVLLASYSLQAEWGDFQEGRHDAEMLTGYPLFPKHVARENDSSLLLEAILWQYARLKSLEQSLAESYYIQEAQSLPGYGSETFMARDAKGAQIYVGCTLHGLTVQYSAKETQKFYGWHTITTLNNEKRTVRLVCAIPGSHYMFVFEDVPTAKYVWKCLVKQHHFFRGNADVLGYFGGMDVKGLAIPDLQSSVMDSTSRNNSFSKNNSMFDLTMEADQSQSNSHARLRLMSQRDSFDHDPHFKITPKSTQTQGMPAFHGDSQVLQTLGASGAPTGNPSTNPYSVQPGGNQGSLANLPNNEFISSQPEFVNTRLQFIQVLDDAERRSFRRRLLPQYRTAPDYDTAIRDKYGSADDRKKQIYSSQPEISLHPNHDDLKPEGMKYSPRRTFPDIGPTLNVKPPEESPKHANVLQNQLMYTYSSPDLVEAQPNEDHPPKKKTDTHFIYGDKTPPPYPFGKSSSNSTPDLASAGKTEQGIPDTHRSRPLLTASLGCLGTRDLCRTYENLTALNEAVLSLRHELTRPNGDSRPAFLHSVPPSYSQDNLDTCYQLSSGHVSAGLDLRDSVNSNYSATETPVVETRPSAEPIYQNVDAIIANITEQQKIRAKSTSELELVIRNLGLDSKTSQVDPSQGPSYKLDEVRPRTNSLAQQDDRRLSDNTGASHPLTRSVPTHNVQITGNSFPLKYPVSSVLPDVDLLPETCFGPGSQPTTLFPIERPDMGSISSCLSTEERKHKPDPLTESMITKIVSKDSRAIDLDSKMNSMEIVNEFEHISRMKTNPEFHSALLPENVARNQYKDIIPYEENRVKITPTKENKTGYINASHITASVGLNQKFYICAQGPLASTVGHFWQAVWESDVRLIVMLNSVSGDGGTSRSFPYWPLSDNTSVECDQFRIYRKHSTKSSHHVTCRLQLVNIPQKNSRSVWHLQYTDWVDHGCPEDVESFITFLEELSTLRRVTFSEVEGVGRNKNTPVLVHCSAGVGRSGVTILSDILLDTADHNLPIDVPKVLTHLRHQRMCLVQSFKQYQFVYKVMLAYLEKCRLI